MTSTVIHPERTDEDSHDIGPGSWEMKGTELWVENKEFITEKETLFRGWFGTVVTVFYLLSQMRS